MARRLYRVNSVPDFPAWDEPVVVLGSTPLGLRSLAAMGLGLALVGAGFAAGGPVIAPGPVPLTLGLLLGLMGGLGLLLWGVSSGPWRGGLPVLGLLLSPRPLRVEEAVTPRLRGAGEVVEVEADPDTGVARVEVEGYAVSPRSGEPLPRVEVEVDGRRLAVETEDGRYYLELELPRGEHLLRVLVPGTGAELRRAVVRVV